MKKKIQKLFNLFGYYLIKKRNFEKLYRTLDHTIKYLIKNEDPVIFDVGAHTGESVIRFRNLFKNLNLHCFEPYTKSYNILKKYENDKTKINNFALGDTNEVKKFYINKHSSTSGFYKLFEGLDINNNTLIEQIQIKTIDQYVDEKKINFIDILKIDVQGYESKVLKGAVKTLENKVKIIELEIIFTDYYEKKNSFRELESIINPFGFELYTISSPNLENQSYRLKQLDAIYVSNKFF